MKTVKKVFILFILAPFLCWAKPPIAIHLQNYSNTLSNQDENRIFFLTHPRSGTNWSFYIMQYFTQRPISYYYTYHEAYDLPQDFTKPFIHHCHDANFFNEIFGHYSYLKAPNKNKDKLFILIRDPTETFFREKDSFNTAVSQLYEESPYGVESFFNNLSFYDSWSSKTKLLIYYEDLINYPNEIIKEILFFLDDSINSLDNFMLNYEEHKQKTVKYYDEVHHSYSKGDCVDFHQKKYSHQEKKNLQNLIKEKDPILWNKYLKRYEI